jgi:anti-sigma factor RsiW
MNCQEAILRLPWWLNGSLEPAERREVDDHLAGCAPCREALEETRLAWEIFGQHIPIEALVAYAADAADGGPEGTDRIDPALLERHLADCPQCMAELEMVRASRLLSEHGDVPLLAPRPSTQKAPVEKRRERGWQAAALAAGLTGLVAIGGWVGSVQQVHQLEQAAESPVLRGVHVHEHSQGTGNAAQGQGATALGALGARAFGVRPILAQLSADAVVRGPGSGAPGSAGNAGNAGSSEQTVQLPAAGEVTLLLNSPADTPVEHAYRVLDATGRELASGKGLAPSPLQAYLVTVDAKLLPPGHYTIQLYIPNGGTAGTQSFPFTVR